jgi:gliding motility-associated-like protein
MNKHILYVALALLAAMPATGQISPYRKLYADPKRPGILLDSTQIKIAIAREAFMQSENAKRLTLNAQRTTQNAERLTLNAERSSVIGHPSSILGSCTVKASFTPNNDTTLYTGQGITYTNTSQGADSYEWIVDTYFKYTTTDLVNYVPAVGITPILLVAHQGGCTDTATTYIVRNGTPPTDIKQMSVAYGLPETNEWGSVIVAAKSDGYLMAGVSGLYGQADFVQPYFVRVSENGCILWSRELPLGREIQVRSVITTNDSGFVALVILRDDLDKSYLVKFDKNGNLLWSHSYHGTYDLTWFGEVKEMQDHSLMLLAGNYGGKYYLLTKLDPQGAFLWQKKYLIDDADYGSFTDLLELNGFAYLTGYYYQAVNPIANQWNQLPMLIKLDAATGNLVWSRAYSSDSKFLSFLGIQKYKDGIIMNGFADSLVKPYNNEYTNSAVLVEANTDGDIRGATEIYNLPTELNAAISTSLTVDENNAVELFYAGAETIALQPGFADFNFYLRLDANKNILWQQNFFGVNQGYYDQAVTTPNKGLAMIGQRGTPLSSAVEGFALNFVLQKVDSNGVGPGPLCNQYPSGSVLTYLAVDRYPLGTPVVTDQVVQVSDQPIAATSPNSELRHICPEYVPPCSFLKLSGKSSVCNLKDTLEFIAHKDPSCTDPISWTYDVTNIKTTYQDGKKARLLFNAPGIYKIRVEKPAPCTDMADSIMVTAAPALVNFSLGPDTALCTSDSLLLRPQGIYDSYLWQDGSTTDSFKVKTAGRYWLLVTDSCGNQKADTINVDFKSALTLDLGAPRLICASDSVYYFNPPTGYRQYNWTPLFRLITMPDGQAVFFPGADTTYQLSVLDNGGCTGMGNLQIRVYPGSQVQLGNDTAICSGASITFSTGGNFSSYAWSDGETASAISVQTAGTYSVQTTDANNCKSRDTIVLTLYPPLALRITGGEALCKNQTLVLDAGAGYAGYSWQNGATAETFTVPDTGYYRVQVVDQHDCVAADSIHIANYASAPTGFLPADTSVCKDGGGTIQPRVDFAKYTWSTGETAAALTVTVAGKYMLRVVDQSGCIGMDSVMVELKDCAALLVFPNAFTPNGDGKNDVFRLRYPGVVNGYRLQIFNRWGQLLFQGSDPYGGWDGTISGAAQPSGTYIWVARFTDPNGKAQTLRGTVVLIR